MELNLHEAAYQRELKDRATLRLAKQQEMRKVWEDLFFILAGEAVFKKCPDFHDYASFEKAMRATLEAVRPQQPPPSPPVANSPEGPLPRGLALGGPWARLDYSPPEDATKLAMDFLGLQDCYGSTVLSPSREMILDLSLLKIIRAVSRLFVVAWSRGDTTLSPLKARKQKVLARQTDILEAFYSLENNKLKKQSLTGLAAAISARLLSKGIKPPSRRTIIRYLQADARTHRDLLGLGVLKDKTGSVQETTPKPDIKVFCRH